MIHKYTLIEVWITPGKKNKPEERRNRVSHFSEKERDLAFKALSNAEGDMNRLLENVDDHKQIWHQ